MAERRIEVDRIENIVNVFGSFDQNIRIVETELDVAVTDRDSSLRISGSEENVALAEKAIEMIKLQGIDKTHIFCYQNNETGQSFWRDFGFNKREDVFVYSFDNDKIGE